MTTDYIQNAQLSLAEKVVLEAMRADIEATITANLGTDQAAQALAIQYTLAATVAADFHMQVDTSLLTYSALTGGSNAAAQSVLLNAMQVACDAHALSVG